MFPYEGTVILMPTVWRDCCAGTTIAQIKLRQASMPPTIAASTLPPHLQQKKRVRIISFPFFFSLLTISFTWFAFLSEWMFVILTEHNHIFISKLNFLLQNVWPALMMGSAVMKSISADWEEVTVISKSKIL